jgi:hypothetical protein
VLYGGAGGGGKSHGIRSAAVEINADLASLGYPGRWGAIFCSTYKELAGRQMVKIKKELGHLGRIRVTHDKQLHFEFKNPDLGGFYLRNLQNSDEYRGVEYDWVLVDELTLLSDEEFTDLLYCLRSDTHLPYKPFGAASNPDGPGHTWVKSFWIDRDPIKYHEFKQDPRNFVFIQAMVTDNPVADEAMIANIASIKDPVKRKARLEGDWNINFGARFGHFRRLVHVFTWKQFEEAYGGDTPWQELLSRRICSSFTLRWTTARRWTAPLPSIFTRSTGKSACGRSGSSTCRGYG